MSRVASSWMNGPLWMRLLLALQDLKLMPNAHPLFRVALLIFFLIVGAHFSYAAVGQSQPESDDELRAVIVLTRHGVRTPIESETRGGAYNAQPWPSWPAPPGVLTPHGTDALRLMGEYYRSWYPSLLQHVSCASPGIYVEANTTQKTIR